MQINSIDDCLKLQCDLDSFVTNLTRFSVLIFRPTTSLTVTHYTITDFEIRKTLFN